MRKLKGVIVSDKMSKTVVVRIDRLKKHSKYNKFYKSSRKLKAHVETGQYQARDEVLIQEIRPMSKDKRWQVIELIKRPEVAVEEEKQQIWFNHDQC